MMTIDLFFSHVENNLRNTVHTGLVIQGGAHMKSTKRLSSKERMLLAINHQEPDRVPFYLRLLTTFPKYKDVQDILPPELRWSNQFERVEKYLTCLGIDDFLMIDALLPLNLEEVKVRTKIEPAREERHCLITKEYETPKGVLREIVKQTADWVHGDDIPFIDDYKVVRSKEFLIKSSEDIERLKCLLRKPKNEEIVQFRDAAKEVKQFADTWGVLIVASVQSPGTLALFLMGVENLILNVMENRHFILELLDVLDRHITAGLEILLDIGVADVIVVNGFYESLHLWSPQIYKEIFFHPLQRKIQMIHQSGAKCGYVNTGPIIPLVPIYRELKFDILWLLDPVKGEPDLVRLKKEIGDMLCFLGGVNSAITIGRGSVEDVKNATLNAIRILGPGGGLILSASPSIYEDAPWENVMAMIETWREHGKYPL